MDYELFQAWSVWVGYCESALPAWQRLWNRATRCVTPIAHNVPLARIVWIDPGDSFDSANWNRKAVQIQNLEVKMRSSGVSGVAGSAEECTFHYRATSGYANYRQMGVIASTAVRMIDSHEVSKACQLSRCLSSEAYCSIICGVDWRANRQREVDCFGLTIADVGLAPWTSRDRKRVDKWKPEWEGRSGEISGREISAGVSDVIHKTLDITLEE